MFIIKQLKMIPFERKNKKPIFILFRMLEHIASYCLEVVVSPEYNFRSNPSRQSLNPIFEFSNTENNEFTQRFMDMNSCIFYQQRLL